MPFPSSYRGKQCGNEEWNTWDLRRVACGAPFIWYRDTYNVIQIKSPAKNFPQMTSLSNLGVHVIGVCFTDNTKRKHPMIICVSKNYSFYIMWHQLFPFSHSQSFGVPVTHWVFPPVIGITTGNTHNMFSLALMTSAWKTCPSLHGWVITLGFTILSLLKWSNIKLKCVNTDYI